MEENTIPTAATQSNMTRSIFPPETPVGMAYVPWQTISTVYAPEVGLTQGTIFPDLDKPWLGSSAFTGRSIRP